MRKIEYPVNKKEWCPSLIPGPLTLISTYSSKRVPNIAPKSWIQMAAFEPPMLMFSGTKGNTTENNILRTKCFVVNIVDSTLAPKVYGCLKWFGRERIERMGLTLGAASQIEAPLVDDCKAHLECRLHATRKMGSGFVVFGEIVAASIWDEIASAERGRKYALLDQALFLEEGGLYASVNRPVPASPGPCSKPRPG